MMRLIHTTEQLRIAAVALLIALTSAPVLWSQTLPPLPPNTLVAPSQSSPMPSGRLDQAELLQSQAPQVRQAPAIGEVGREAVSNEREQRYLIERVDPQRTLDVQIGRPSVLRFRTAPFRDQIGDPQILDAVNLTETELSITGKKVGSTVLNLWFKDRASDSPPEVLSYLVRVSEDPERSRYYDLLLANLERDVNRGFPNSVVKLSYVGSQVVVRGKAKDIEEATNILRIIAQSLPTEGQADSAASVVPTASQNRSNSPLASVPPFQAVEGFTIDEIVESGGVDAVFQGNSPTGANQVRINNRLINLLEIAGVHQVALKVTLAEVVRDAGRSLVSDVGIGDSATRTGSSFADLSTLDTGIGEFTFRTNYFFLQLDALKRLGLARSLAEPNLTSLNGQPATFFVGGEFPILESVGTVSTVTQNIRYVPVGIQLSVLPTVTDGDRIRLQLRSVVSERAGQGLAGNQNNNQNQNNDPATPPSLSVRAFTTTVELRESESLAIAGLIRSSLTSASARVPFLGDIPMIGNIFSRNSSNYQEQELILVVTPHLVAGVPPEKTQALPGSDSFEPDDIEFFLMGGIAGNVANDYRTPVRTDLDKMKAFRHAEQKYILGMPGHVDRRPHANIDLHDPIRNEPTKPVGQFAPVIGETP